MWANSWRNDAYRRSLPCPEIHSRKILIIIIALIHNARRITTSNMVRIMCGSRWTRIKGISMHLVRELCVHSLWFKASVDGRAHRTKKNNPSCVLWPCSRVLEPPPMPNASSACLSCHSPRDWSLESGWLVIGVNLVFAPNENNNNNNKRNANRKWERERSHDACKSRTMVVRGAMGIIFHLLEFRSATRSPVPYFPTHVRHRNDFRAIFSFSFGGRGLHAEHTGSCPITRRKQKNA